MNKLDSEWEDELTPEQYHVLREKGTEPAFSGDLLDVTDDGEFKCAACGNVIFKSNTKYDTDTPGLVGWPSFCGVIPETTVLAPDDTLGMSRTEVMCANCGGHLGHLFDDPSSPTGQHYCINSLSLKFTPDS